MPGRTAHTMSTQFHFLVVEDQAITRSIIVTMLKRLGYSKITEADNGKNALALLQAGDSTDTPINFVISDWRMPVMDGIALTRAIRASDALQHLPVLLMTAFAETDYAGMMLHTGADECIDKQFLSVKFLDGALNTIFAKRSLVSA